MTDAKDDAPAERRQSAAASEEEQGQELSVPASSVLSDAPPTDSESKESESNIVVAHTSGKATTNGTGSDPKASNGWQAPQHSTQTEDLVKRINASAEAARANGTPPWEAAKEQVMKDMVTSEAFANASGASSTPRGRGRGGRGGRGAKRASLENGDGEGALTIKTEGETPTPGSSARGRGRGRGGGRPRGRGRGGRGGKRKREDDDEGDESDSSDEVTPIATMTKSGRSIQKPTSFVPPPPSPTTNKRKRPYNRRNPESAVCKVCLRGVSPTSNMIVFCDGCNTAYHQWCHKPPIAQAVIDEADKEWNCMNCEEEKAENAPELDISGFVSVPDAPEEQRRAYFASLPHGALVTLLVTATTQNHDLPLFDPKFKALLANGIATTNGTSNASISMPPPPHPHAHAHHATAGASPWANGSPFARPAPAADDAAYTDDVHPPNYPRPGQGLMSTLPPETGEELQWLVDDDDKYGVFTHIYQDPMAASAGASGTVRANGT